MSRGNKENQPEPEPKLAAISEAGSYHITLYIEYLEAQFTLGISHFTNKHLSSEAVHNICIMRDEAPIVHV